MKLKFPILQQSDSMDCGPTCLQMVSRYYGRNYSLKTLRERCNIARSGVSLLGISEAAESIGFRTMGVKVEFNKLVGNDSPLPLIAHWNQEHFIVVYAIKNDKVSVADPAHGKMVYSKEEFIRCWASTINGEEPEGICLLLEPTPDFFNQEDEKPDRSGFSFLFRYLRPHKKFIFQLVLGLLLGSLLQLAFPFLTQAVVDVGINTRNLNFIWLVLIAQLILFVSRMSVEFIRSWILLHVSTRINISLISDFLIKLMRLPIRFFDTKMTGDIIQRIEDHGRIENFLTGQTLNVLFSMVNILLFGAVLAWYNLQIFLVFVFGSLLYFVWVWMFMKRRRTIDHKRFAQMSSEQSNLIQMIMGMQEIKLNNCEKQKRWEWERIQTRLFRVNVQSLSLNQYQQLGGLFFNETKNIVITVLAATAVVHGNMTLGMMLSVQYILGQLNSPIDQMINFAHAAQDAKISLERLGEIHNSEDEEPDVDRLKELPEKAGLNIENVSFRYEGPTRQKCLILLLFVFHPIKLLLLLAPVEVAKPPLLKCCLGFTLQLKAK
ncbi:cysteine peptidase family C39 domain-containing protein [Geofilum rubicundum]|uniref:ABC transporter ATP-binding protein n=1 Tax=Geofilum rubicundum JCM 15548 TaxID=1236989 RepID=A0A0E9LPS3_9BACT|nr:cysteine peptidase family C39 domain-containing protein [Geofilum rubicundum]GAO27587.1 ABC transporter ATP-binding protein [Geofilum rubicundum JCM 15548]